MGGFYININISSDNPESVRSAVISTFEESKFPLLQVDLAGGAVNDNGGLPSDQEWYGVLVTGTDRGWVTVYVDDWKDSGVLAQGITARLGAQAIEIWVANDTHWGYNYWHSGQVRDRFADDPREVSDGPAEEPKFAGNAGILVEVGGRLKQLAAILDEAHESAGSFAGESLGALCDAIDLPFERAFTGYEYFFTDDPEDYVIDHPDWPESRHLCFGLPKGRETLAE